MLNRHDNRSLDLITVTSVLGQMIMSQRLDTVFLKLWLEFDQNKLCEWQWVVCSHQHAYNTMASLMCARQSNIDVTLMPRCVFCPKEKNNAAMPHPCYLASTVSCPVCHVKGKEVGVCEECNHGFDHTNGKRDDYQGYPLLKCKSCKWSPCLSNVSVFTFLVVLFNTGCIDIVLWKQRTS